MNSETGRIHGQPDGLRVVMLINYMPLHFLSTMTALAARLPELRFLLSEPMNEARSWKPEYGTLKIHLQRSLKFKTTHHHPYGFDYPGHVLMPYSTPWDLARLKPDVLVSLEVGPRTIQAWLLQKLGFRYKLIIQVRESMITAMFRGGLRQRLRNFLLPKADQVWVNGRSGFLYARSCGVPESRIAVIPSGTDFEHFGKTRNTPADTTFKLIFVGALIPLKNILPFCERLLEIHASCPRPVQLTVIGEGELHDAIQKLPWTDACRLDSRGRTGYDELDAIYSQHHVGIMPSLSDEWGMVVNEAMACGLPVLGCTGSQAVEEMVRTGENGWAYPPNDETALRAAMEAMLACPPSTLKRMSDAARLTAREFSASHCAELMEREIRKVGQSGPACPWRPMGHA
jgi:glycosyltransferase involved in cell wall biosynthesis